MDFDTQMTRDEFPSLMSLLLDSDHPKDETLPRQENAIEVFYKNASSSSSSSSLFPSSSQSPKDFFLQNFPHVDDHQNEPYQTPLINGFFDYSNSAITFSMEGFSSSSSTSPPNKCLPMFPTSPTPLSNDPIRDLPTGFDFSSSTHNSPPYHFHGSSVQTHNNGINLNDESPSAWARNLFPTSGGGDDRRGGTDDLGIFGGGGKLPFWNPSLTRISEVESEKDQESTEEEPNNDGEVMMENEGSPLSAQLPRRSAVVKGQWTFQEDKLLVHLVAKYGLKSWSLIARTLGGRAGKQCRERWYNHLKPDIKKDAWSKEEDEMLIQAHMEMGNKWAEIAKRMPGRTENSIKNHWNATKRRQYTTRRHFRSHEPSAAAAALKDYIHAVTSLKAVPKPSNFVAGSSSSTASSASEAPPATAAGVYDLNEALEPPLLFGGGEFGSAIDMAGLSFGDNGNENSFGMSVSGYNGEVDGSEMMGSAGGGGAAAEEVMGKEMDFLDMLIHQNQY